MNRTRVLILGLAALVLSAVVTVLVYRELDARFNPTIENPDRIVVAKEKLKLGMMLEAHHVATMPWPKGTPLEGSFSDPAEVIGRAVLVPLLPNEPVLESKLAATQGTGGLWATIPEGMRAVSVRVNSVVGVAGFVLPGTRVDVILTGRPPNERNGENVSKTILENVQVLAADQNIEPDSAGQPQKTQVITLLVTPEDAQKLALAAIDGRLQLALRNPLDELQADPKAFRQAELYGTPSTVPLPPDAPRPRRRPPPQNLPPPPPPVKIHKVELIQGTKREDLTFEKQTKPPEGQTGNLSGGGQ